jgi:zinc transporter ZupT
LSLQAVGAVSLALMQFCFRRLIVGLLLGMVAGFLLAAALVEFGPSIIAAAFAR